MKTFFSILFGLSFLAFQVNAQQCFVDCLPAQAEQPQMDEEADHSCCEGMASHDDEEEQHKNSHHCNETHCLSALTFTSKALAFSSSSQDDFQEALAVPQYLNWSLGSNQTESHLSDLGFLFHPTSKLGLYIVLKRLRVS